MRVCVCVCIFVCVSVCAIDYINLRKPKIYSNNNKKPNLYE